MTKLNLRNCSLCQIPIASGDCPHILVEGERVIMSTRQWNRLTNDVAQWRKWQGARDNA